MMQAALRAVAGCRNPRPSGDGAVVAQSPAGSDHVAAKTNRSMVGLLAAAVESKEEVRMTCPRCRGLLVKDYSVVESLGDLSEVPGCSGPTMRCINCGYLETPVVRANRLHPPVAKQSVPARLGGRESSRRRFSMLRIRMSQPIQRRNSP